MAIICLIGSLNLFLSNMNRSSLNCLNIALLLVDLGPEHYDHLGGKQDPGGYITAPGHLRSRHQSGRSNEKRTTWISSMLLSCQCAR